MHLLLDVPISLRLGLLVVIGLILGGQINRAIYQWGWPRRWISPWTTPPSKTSPPDVPPRGWLDCLPVFGWLRLRREVEWHGRGFWIRPLLIELATGLMLPWLYWWETERLGLYFAPALLTAAISDTLQTQTHAQYLSHAVLFIALMIATFIDFDEQTIPDAVTVPGTLAGLSIVALIPFVLPPTLALQNGTLTHQTLHFAPRANVPAWCFAPGGLCLALLAWSLWAVALLDATCTLRRGWRKAMVYYLVSIVRRGSWRWMLPVAVVGGLIIGGSWLGLRASGRIEAQARWLAVSSSIVGIVFGGGLIWLVRLVGSRALGVEAMGFGDVTLMAMIGAFLGWQATVVVFFLAPVTALLIAVLQWAATGRNDIAFGPYLSLGAMLLIIMWRWIWIENVSVYFSLGWWIPFALACCLVMMGGMLWIWRIVRDSIWAEEAKA